MATRPIWNGTISFGLVAIPVTLYSGEQAERAHFHLLDKKNKARIHYERINDMTGKKVSWENVVKAYEFEKNNFVILDEQKLKEAEDKDLKTIDIKEFVAENSIEYPYFDKPYFLIPTKGGEKGYFLLIETLQHLKKIAIAKVVLKTKQHIAVIAPYHKFLLLNLLRFDDEVRKPEELYSPKPLSGKNKISQAEIKIAEQLIESMSAKWNPKKYHNESKEIIQRVINQKIKKGKSVEASLGSKKTKKETGKVVDFMELLKKSVKDKKGKRTTGTTGTTRSPKNSRNSRK